MFGKNLLLKVLPLTGALLLAGCADKSTAPAATSTDTNRQVFQVKGLLKELKQNGKTVVIAHEEIPDYMVAMTMDFDVKDKNELKGLQPNDYLAFQMVVTKDDGWIENLRKIPGAAPADAGAIMRRLAGVKVQQWRKQEGPRYRGPSCLRRLIPGRRPGEAARPWRGVTGAWSERAGSCRRSSRGCARDA